MVVDWVEKQARKVIVDFMKKNNIENFLFFFISFVVFLIAAYFLVFKLEFVYGDSLSRTFHAYSVFFGNEPKLSSIGFVWPPIPTLVQLPFVLIKPLNTYGFAGNITSALFMSLAVVFLNKIFKKFKLSFLVRMFFLLTFVLNPMILFFGANGMSEAVAIFFLVITIYLLISYLNSKKIVHLLGLGTTVSLAIMSRWEMVALIPIIILMLIVFIFLNSSTKRIVKTEGVVILFLAPIIFTISIWIFSNWIIMGDPLHFLTSVYANTSQSGKLSQEVSIFTNMQGNFVAVFSYLTQRVFFLFPAYLILGLLTILKGIRDKKLFLPTSLLLLSLSLLSFHFVMLYKGQSFGWLRFSIYIIPFAYILLGYLITDIKNRYYQNIIILGSVFIVCASSISTVYAMANPNLGREENLLINSLLKKDLSYISEMTYKNDVEIANYVKNNIKEKKILIDDFTGFPIVYFTQQTGLFVETIDENFELVLSNLLMHSDVGYLLVHSEGGVGDLDAINRKFPGIFENGTDFTVLEKDFGKWRLYKIVD